MKRWYRYLFAVVIFTAIVIILGLALLIRMQAISDAARQQNQEDRAANTHALLENLAPDHEALLKELNQIKRDLWELERELGFRGPSNQ